MINVKLLDLPKLELSDDFYDKSDITYHTKRKGYTAHQILDKQLLNTIQTLFNYGTEYGTFHTNVQVINPDFNDYIHWDPRAYAINYVIKLGGDNVTTSFFNKDETLVESTVLPIHQWHILDVQQLHSVSNIETDRIAITLSFRKLNDKMREWIETKVMK
jgi:hypothetical protein